MTAPADTTVRSTTVQNATVRATARHDRGTMARIAAVLNRFRVEGFSYSAQPDGTATVEIRLHPGDLRAVRTRLERVVDIVRLR